VSADHAWKAGFWGVSGPEQLAGRLFDEALPRAIRERRRSADPGGVAAVFVVITRLACARRHFAQGVVEEFTVAWTWKAQGAVSTLMILSPGPNTTSLPGEELEICSKPAFAYRGEDHALELHLDLALESVCAASAGASHSCAVSYQTTPASTSLQ